MHRFAFLAVLLISALTTALLQAKTPLLFLPRRKLWWRSGGGSQPIPGTPPGTYKVTVSSELSHTTTFAVRGSEAG
jgi:hypothetical protein